MKRNRFTMDRGAGPPRFHTTEQIGPKRHRTPEGFLLCEDVPVARTGWMLYGPREVPVPVGPDGYVMIQRDAATLFADSVFDSLMGKPVTNDHPLNGVDSSNWKNVAVGTVHNLRQGAGADSDILLADLLITDAQAIRDVLAGKVEVSMGYEATYQTTGVGEGRQLNIIGNHIALVERGRCGPRCAIGDRLSPTTPTKGKTMATKKRVAVSDAVREMITNLSAELAAGDADVLDEDDAGVHVHVHTGDGSASKTVDAADTTEARFKSIEDTLAKVADAIAKGIPIAAKTGDDVTAEVEDCEGKGMTGDSKALEAGYRAVMADAEVLVPGIAVPAFSADAKRAATVDAMCQTRRKALDAFYVTGEGKMTVDSVRGHSTLDTASMTCVDVANAFRAAAGARKLMNNRTTVGDSAHRVADGLIDGPPAKGVPTPADFNKAMRAHYGNAA